MASKRTPQKRASDVAAVDPKLERLLRLCGIDTLPQVQTQWIPLERILLPKLVKPSSRFIRSIALVGIRQPPSVAPVEENAEPDNGRYVVVMGRRRIAAA